MRVVCALRHQRRWSPAGCCSGLALWHTLRQMPAGASGLLGRQHSVLTQRHAHVLSIAFYQQEADKSDIARISAGATPALCLQSMPAVRLPTGLHRVKDAVHQSSMYTTNMKSASMQVSEGPANVVGSGLATWWKRHGAYDIVHPRCRSMEQSCK